IGLTQSQHLARFGVEKPLAVTVAIFQRGLYELEVDRDPLRHDRILPATAANQARVQRSTRALSAARSLVTVRASDSKAEALVPGRRNSVTAISHPRAFGTTRIGL